MDELKSIRQFVAVVEAGNFTKAAQRCASTQPSVSRHVAQLEDALGTLLLQRSTRKLSLTEAGQIFYDRARVILDDLEAASQAVRQLSNAPTGVLRITAPSFFGRRKVVPHLPDFHAKYPGITIGLSLSDNREDVIGEGFDVAIRFGELKDSNLVARQLTVSNSVICAHSSYLASNPALDTPEALAQHNCLLFRRNFGRSLWKLKKGNAVTTTTVSGSLFSDTGEALLEAALCGLGVIQLPTWMVDTEIDSGNLVVLLPDWEILPLNNPIHAVYPQKRNLAPKVRLFVDFLQARLN